MNKQELRKAIRTRKRAMTEEEIERRSRSLCQKFLESDAYRACRTLYGYLPYNQEVRTVPILAQALADGKQVAVPKVYGDDMKFIVLTDLTQVSRGYAGIPEPIADEPVAEDETALVLMPGLAFDPQGHRIGYGGGFYDKFLSREPNHPTLALCYEFQMVEHLETEEFDIPVDTVIWA
ncbi:MAG: 5-formyltetrahydrofolate cyclo-ligase [Clostridiales bacterium]|nr:5-formyltetrahydrofolate cyclo-ligase [Clostridiales bacterium]